MARPRKSDPNRPEWAKRLEATREAIGLHNAAFARLLGIPAGRYNAWERGERVPSIEHWTLIADATGISLDILLSGKPRPGLLDRCLCLSCRTIDPSEPVRCRYLRDQAPADRSRD